MSGEALGENRGPPSDQSRCRGRIRGTSVGALTLCGALAGQATWRMQPQTFFGEIVHAFFCSCVQVPSVQGQMVAAYSQAGAKNSLGQRATC